MVFSSMIFIWAFLPIVFILDRLTGLPASAARKGRGRRGAAHGGRAAKKRRQMKNTTQNLHLLIASLFF